MAPDGGGRLIGGDVSGCLEGHAGVVGAVLILPLLAGLALTLLHDLLGALGFAHCGGFRRQRTVGVLGALGTGEADGLCGVLLGAGKIEDGGGLVLGAGEADSLRGVLLGGAGVVGMLDAHPHRHLRRVGLEAEQARLCGVLLRADRTDRGDGLNRRVGLVDLLGGGHHAPLGLFGGLSRFVRAQGLGGAVGVVRAVETVCRGVITGNCADHNITSSNENGESISCFYYIRRAEKCKLFPERI